MSTALHLPDHNFPQFMQSSLSEEDTDHHQQDEDIGGSNDSPAAIIGVEVLVHILASHETAEDRPNPVQEVDRDDAGNLDSQILDIFR